MVNSSVLTSFSRPRSRYRGLTRGDDSLYSGEVLRRRLVIVAERWGGCRRHGRALGGSPWWMRESHQYGGRERCASLVRSMARFHEMAPDFWENIHADCG